MFSVDYSLARAFCVLLFSNHPKKRGIDVIKLFFSHIEYIQDIVRDRAHFHFFILQLKKKQMAFEFQIFLFTLIYLKQLVHTLGINVKKYLQCHVVI